MSAYGSRCVLDCHGVDLYGFDICLDAVHKLRRLHPGIGVILCIPGAERDPYRKELANRARVLQIADRVLFLTQPLTSAMPLWSLSDVYLRPTTTDGDSIAIREALSLGVPVVASDASERPEGVWLFPSRNVDAFIEKTAEALRRGRIEPAQARNSTFEAIVEIYREACGV
jgi:glycosyltransferase involved in cell wall biosynthesis